VTRPAAALPTVLVALLAAPAALAGPEQDDAGPGAALSNTAEGAAFTVRGEASHPDGSTLHVTLRLRGSDPPLDAAFFRITLRQGAYSARKTWEQSFPPGTYGARVDLIVSEQSPAIRRTLGRRYGFREDHRELLLAADVAIGTPEEQREFALAALDRLEAFRDGMEAIRLRVADATAAPAAEQPGWAELEESLYDALRAALAGPRELSGRYVVWPGLDLFERLMTAHVELTRAIQAHGEGRDAGHDLRRIEHFLRTQREVLAGRREALGPEPEPEPEPRPELGSEDPPTDPAAPDDGEEPQ